MLKDNLFFKPTALYKEYMILDLIEKNPHITQREMSEVIGIAVSMVNSYLDQFEQDNLIKRQKHSTKTVEYFITKKGIERRKLLNIWYLKSSQSIYLQAKDNIYTFLNQIIEKGFKKILMYGAGEVAEIMLVVMNEDYKLPLEVLAVVDDNKSKQGTLIVNKPIIKKEDIIHYQHDGILISSHRHRAIIKQSLIELNYKEEDILEFFYDED